MNSNYKILVIEDEFIIANQIKVFLEMEGYNIIGPTDNYPDSVKLIKAEIPDLIIADIQLHDDIDAGIRISNFISNNYNIPLIFLSGYSDKETILKAKGTNPNTFLIKPKPLDKAQLLATVQIALPKDSDFRSKIKVISLKGKEIDILSNYDYIKQQERVDNIVKRIEVNEISFIETYNHHFKNTLLIRFVNRATGFLVRAEFEDIQTLLPNYFLRTHKSYMVNMKNISAYKLPHSLHFKNHCIPIGEKHKNDVLEFLSENK